MKFHRGKYNPTSDAVWLAAFAADSPRAKNVLDVGVGSGGVSLCFLNYHPRAKITGIDVSADMLNDAAENAALNEQELELIHTDILSWKTSRTFDLVMTNPPYFKGSARAGDMHHNADLSAWVRACIKRVRPRGYFCIICDAARLAEVVMELKGFGDIRILPLFSGANAAERVIVCARQGVKTGTTILSALSMNDNRVLRDGLTINQIFTNLRRNV